MMMSAAPPLAPTGKTRRAGLPPPAPASQKEEIKFAADTQADKKSRTSKAISLASKRVSRVISKALPTKQKVEPPTAMVPAPALPQKVSKAEVDGLSEVASVTSATEVAAKQQKKPARGFFARLTSLRLLGGNGGDSQALAAAEIPEERTDDEINVPEPENGANDNLPRYQELPSLLEFCIEDDDDERTDLIDRADPKINPSTIVVLAFGEGTIQSGLASSDKGPDNIFPTICGEPQSFNVRVMDSNGRDREPENPIRFGQDVTQRRGYYALDWFNDTENGRPKYTRVGEAMAYNSSHVMRRPLKQDALILPMHVDMDLDRRTKMVCLGFEKVGARAVRICSEEKVALQYVTKQENPTGIIVDIGHSKTRVVAIVEGEIAEVSLQRTMAGGKTMTARMFALLKQKTAIFEQTVTGMEFAREAKEKHAYVSERAPTEQEITSPHRDVETVFHLNDGQDIVLRQERFLCSEILFQPEKDQGKLSYVKAPSVQQCIFDCLKTMDREHWADLLRNVVVIGGSSQLPNLKKRLETELYKLLPPAYFQKLSVTIEPFASWKGARQVSLNESDIDLWIPRREWRSGGESAVQARLKQLR